jgi:hypothetical protein
MLMNNIGQPRFSALLSRMMGMKGQGLASAPMLAPEIGPSVDVNQQDDVTLPFLRQEKLLASYRGQGGVAAEFTRFRVRNPVGSGVVLVIESISVISASAARYGSTFAIADETNLFRLNQRDMRWGQTSTCIFSSGTNAAAITDTVFGIINTSDASTRVVNAVIPPGAAFYVMAETVNTVATLNVMARERSITNDELSTG